MTENEIYEMVIGIDKLTAERDALRTSNDSYITLANTAYELTEQRTAERDEYKQRMQRLMTTVSELTKERDAYAKAADDMAASHKVERDHWYAFQNTQVSLMNEITAERDELSRL